MMPIESTGSYFPTAFVSGQSFLSQILVVKFVDIIPSYLFCPSVFVDVINPHYTTATSVTIGGVVNCFTTYLTSDIPSSTASYKLMSYL